MIQRQFVSIFTMSHTEFGREQHHLKRSEFVFRRAIGSFQFFHHTPLSRSTLGTIRFDQRPVSVPLAILHSVTRANEHVRSWYASNRRCQDQGLHYNNLRTNRAIPRKDLRKFQCEKNPENTTCQTISVEVGLAAHPGISSQQDSFNLPGPILGGEVSQV